MPGLKKQLTAGVIAELFLGIRASSTEILQWEFNGLIHGRVI
jgi:hypothetical protein